MLLPVALVAVVSGRTKDFCNVGVLSPAGIEWDDAVEFFLECGVLLLPPTRPLGPADAPDPDADRLASNGLRSG